MYTQAMPALTCKAFRESCTVQHARVAQLPTSTFYDWRNGVHSITVLQLQALAKARGMVVRIVESPTA